MIDVPMYVRMYVCMYMYLYVHTVIHPKLMLIHPHFDPFILMQMVHPHLSNAA